MSCTTGGPPVFVQWREVLCKHATPTKHQRNWQRPCMSESRLSGCACGLEAGLTKVAQNISLACLYSCSGTSAGQSNLQKWLLLVRTTKACWWQQASSQPLAHPECDISV